jgi:plasmid stabilization system protein ParE
MRQVLLLADAVDDLEAARDFYDAREIGAGKYCVDSLLADVEKLHELRGIHRMQFGCHRMIASRFPFGIYYRDSGDETQIVAILDLRREPDWIQKRVTERVD